MLTDRTKRSTISHIQDVDIIVHDKNHDGARTRLVMWLVWRRTHKLQVLIFSLIRTLPYGLGYVARELGLQYNVVVQVVFEVLGAFATTMAIIDTEYLEFRPPVGGGARGFLCRLDHI